MFRILLIVLSIIIAAFGGVMAYRAWFLEPPAGVVITDTSVRELPNTPRLVGGLALLIIGAVTAFFAARRKIG